MNTQEVDQHLDDVTIKQLTWKPGINVNVAVAILKGFIEDRIQWTDEVDLGFVLPTDVNCIGTTWRRLSNLGILKPMEQFRRSTKDASKGRKVFKYRLANEGLAKAFLKRNGWTPNVTAGQTEMFPQLTPAT